MWDRATVVRTASSPSTTAGRGSTLPKVTIAPEEALGVVGIAEPVIPLPRCWLEPGFLVTVTNIERDPSARLRGILWAQAEALRAAGGPARRATRVYEAHRLGGSDLAIACGTLDGRSYWLVSPSDVAVDWIAAQAAAIERPESREVLTQAISALRKESFPIAELDRLNAALAASAPPPRDPSRIVQGTRKRSKGRR